MELIKLNIGGQLFTTAKLTLLERSDYFSTLFNGNWQLLLDENGAIFIDRDGHLFDMVLKFLRNEAVVLPEDSVILAELKIAADFYGIQSFIDLIKQDEEVRQKAIDDEEAERQKLVKLSVGGQHFTVTKSTLMQQSDYFNALLNRNGSQPHTDNGAIFIDVDGETFRVLLKFVRGEAVDLPENSAALAELKKAADVYSVKSLINLIKRDEAEQKEVFDLHFYVWELNGRGQCQQFENRQVSGKTIRELKAIGFGPMFDQMRHCDFDSSFHMNKKANLKPWGERQVSMRFFLLDIFLNSESHREDDIDYRDDEVEIGRLARHLADAHGIDRAVIDRMKQKVDVKFMDERPASMWLILLDTFLYGESDRKDKNDKDEIDDDDDEVKIATYARHMAEIHGMDRTLIDKLSAYIRKLQAKLKKKK